MRKSTPRAGRKDQQKALRVRTKKDKELFLTAADTQQRIYIEAARLFVSKGFGQTSMGDIAEAVGMSKAGLYHSIASKEDLLFTMINFGLDDFERQVVVPAEGIADPVERLETVIRRHVHNIARVSDPNGNPFTIVVNEVVGLSAKRQRHVALRKRRYVDFLRTTIDELRARDRTTDGIDPTIAALSIIAMVIATAKWMRIDGRLSVEEVSQQIARLALHGVLKPGVRSALRVSAVLPKACLAPARRPRKMENATRLSLTCPMVESCTRTVRPVRVAATQ